MGLFAKQQVCRMSGDTQPHLMYCSDDKYYVVKFQNNPQGGRVLANELLGALLARRLGLPVAEPAVIDVFECLIKMTTEMTIKIDGARKPCRSGLSFGSRYPDMNAPQGNITADHVFDFLPPEYLRSVRNRSDFRGMLVFDKWTGNLDTRQTVFVRSSNDEPFSTLMIDQGSCFNGANWTFSDPPGSGLYYPSTVYESVTGIEDFDPWLGKLESVINVNDLEEAAREIPPEWYKQDAASLRKLLDTLDQRRTIVRRLLQQTCKDSVKAFPNWVRRKRMNRSIAVGARA